MRTLVMIWAAVATVLALVALRWALRERDRRRSAERDLDDLGFMVAGAVGVGTPRLLLMNLVALRATFLSIARRRWVVVAGAVREPDRWRAWHDVALAPLRSGLPATCPRCERPIGETQGVLWTEAEGAVHVVCERGETLQ